MICGQALLVPAELAAQQEHVAGHARGVADGVRVARVHRRDERLEVTDVHRLDGLVEAGVAEGEGELRADAREETLVGDREGVAAP